YADAMTPAAPCEDEPDDAATRVIFAVDDEEVFFQSENAAQLRAAQSRRAVVAGDFNFDHAIRIGELNRGDAVKRPDVDIGARQPPLHLFSRDALLPLRDTRKTVARCAALRRHRFDEVDAACRANVIDHTHAAYQRQPI